MFGQLLEVSGVRLHLRDEFTAHGKTGEDSPLLSQVEKPLHQWGIRTKEGGNAK